MERSLGIDAVPGHASFVALASIGGIRVDLRYATPNNFVGADIYTPFDCAWLHRNGAERLAEAVHLLARRRPGASILVLDALRPQRAQERMWAALAGTNLTDYLACPVRGSIHSFGMAVDAPPCSEPGPELAIGTPCADPTPCPH